jgi:hypothetical protein
MYSIAGVIGVQPIETLAAYVPSVAAPRQEPLYDGHIENHRPVDQYELEHR